MSSSQVVHIIDDDTDVLEELTFLLSAAGFAVQVHESAVAFLNAGPRAQAGCIVTDIRMPGMDGLELQRKLLADHDDTPVILMTGYADVARAVEAMKARAFNFFENPFDNEILLEAIRAALTRRSGERAPSAHGRGSSLSGIPVGTGTPGAGRAAAGWQIEQDHRLPSQSQPANDRGLSRRSYDQVGGRQPRHAHPHSPCRSIGYLDERFAFTGLYRRLAEGGCPGESLPQAG